MKNLLITICTLLIIHNTTMYAQNQYPTIQKNGKQYYEYTINAGEGLFAIARKFNINQNDLHQANPNLTTNIKAGDKILIPIKNNTPQSSDITMSDTTQHIHIHTIQPKETLYSIAKKYNINIDTLITHNPSAKTSIKAGETLIIKTTTKPSNITTPTTTTNNNTPQPTNTHTVQPKETLYSISKKYNIAIHDLITLNPQLKDGLKAGTTIILKKEITTTNNTNQSNKSEQPNNTPKTEKSNISEKTEKIENNNSKPTTLNIAYLLPLIAENTNDEKNTQRFIEFYRGALLALNQAKNEGISANIYTYNLPKDTQKIDTILQQLNNHPIDILIGPAYSEQLNKVLTYTKQHNITTIVPFSNKIDTTLYYPKLIQFNPQQDSLFITVLQNTFAHRNLQYILARFPNCQNKGNQFINELSKLLTQNNKQHTNITITPQNIDSITTKLTPDTTILVLGSSLINDVAPILDSLNRYQLPNLQIWGFEEWGTNTLKKYPQTIYYSLFFANETEEYKTEYKNWFGTRKQTVGVKYDLLGYDLTTLALKDINTNKTTNTLTINQQTNKTQYQQSTPQLQFINNRWINTNYYLLFWDNISIKIMKYEK